MAQQPTQIGGPRTAVIFGITICFELGREMIFSTCSHAQKDLGELRGMRRTLSA